MSMTLSDLPLSRHVRACGCACCRTDTDSDTDTAPTARSGTGDLLDTITWGTSLSDNVITVYFVPDGKLREIDEEDDDYDGFPISPSDYTSEGFNAYEKAQFQKAFDLIEQSVDVEFRITDDPNADFQLVLDTDEVKGDFLGIFNPPGELFEGVGVFDGSQWSRQAGGDLDKGGFGFVTIVHEVLHGLGLAHPHDRGGISTRMPGVTGPYDTGDDDLNQGVYTTMTYNSGYVTGRRGTEPAFNDRYGYEAGPMALDIAALQALYGAANYATADNSYVLPDQNSIGTYWRALWDTGGMDVIRHDGVRDAVIDLRAATLSEGAGAGGFLSSAKGIAGGFTIAAGVVIENAIGGGGDDRLGGNDADNRLEGLAGDDDLRGRAGNDRLLGDGGDDALRGNGGDDRLFGNGGDDTALGGRGDDRIGGGKGHDALRGGAGRDEITGNNGRDQLDGGAGGDSLRGGSGADRLRGDGGADRLAGGAGRDVLIGGGGADDLYGGAGPDTFRFLDVTDSRPGRVDTIHDLSGAQDWIDLSRIDADTGQAGNQDFTFIGQRTLSDAGDLRITRDGDGWRVTGDVDGDGAADLEIRVLGDKPVADVFIL